MAFSTGAKLGPYEILGALGAGGMGEVYRARDPRIGRDVAVKILPANLAGDESRLRRFETEARAAGALNHPNVLVLFDVGAEGGTPYVVTELLEGETLRDRLRGGALPARKAIDIAAQAARGLGAAHEKGIVHRDLKPENLFLTRDGRVKILDFGLAKLISPVAAASGSGDARSIPTVSGAGQVLGTVGYMAPEQVAGKSAGPTADIFALGTVLYEMLSGRRAFQGDSAVDVLHAILREEPPDLASSAGVPPSLERIVSRCLEKQPGERFSSANDLAFALEAVGGAATVSTASRPPGARGSSSRSWLRPVAVAVAAAALTAAGFAAARLTAPPAGPPPKITPLSFRRHAVYRARFAPDGQTVIYGANYQDRPLELFATRVGSPESRALGIEAADVLSVSSSGELALKLGTSMAAGTLARMPLEGGSPRELARDVTDADWSPDGKSLAVLRMVGNKRRIEFPLGTVVAETTPRGGSLRLSPRGDVIAAQWRADGAPTLAIVDPARKTVTPIVALRDAGLQGYCWGPDGAEIRFLRYAGHASEIRSITLSGRERGLMALPGEFVLQDCRPDGGLLVERVNDTSEIAGAFPGEPVERDLSWLDRSEAVDLSADGGTLLFAEMSGTAGQVAAYLRKTDGSAAVRLGDGRPTALSPDGQWALATSTGPAPGLVALPTRAGEVRQLPMGNITVGRSVFLPDGKRIVSNGFEPGSRWRCFVQSLDGGAPEPLTPEGTTRCRLPSPDGRSMVVNGAQLLDLGTRSVRPLPGLTDADEPIRWGADGRSLFVLVRETASAWRIERLDLSNGRRSLVKDIHTAGPVGAGGLVNAHVSADGRVIVYTTSRTFSDLFLIEGLH